MKLPIDHCASDHFIKLLYEVHTDFDYYAFCDQDDIWLPHKLKNSINLFSHNSWVYLFIVFK